MPRSKLKGQFQDANGNIIYHETSSDCVEYKKGTVSDTLDDQIEKVESLMSMIKTYPTTNAGNAYSVQIDTIKSIDDLVSIEGYPLTLKFNSASTSGSPVTVTILPANLGPYNIVDFFGNGIANIRSGLIANLRFDSGATNFQLLGKGGGSGTVTASADKVLSPFTITTDTGTTITGTIPTKLGQTYTPTTYNQSISAKQYLGEDQVILGDPKLISANIKANTSIFSIPGKASVVDTADANALASQILATTIAYINGTRVIGTMPNKQVTCDDFYGGSYPNDALSKALQIIYTPCGTKNYTKKVLLCPPQGYYPGQQNTYVYAEATDIASILGITAAKVVAGNNICGVDGGATIQSLGGIQFDMGTYTSNINYQSTVTITTKITPNAFIIYNNSNGNTNYRHFAVFQFPNGSGYFDSNGAWNTGPYGVSISGNSLVIYNNAGNAFSAPIYWVAFRF